MIMVMKQNAVYQLLRLLSFSGKISIYQLLHVMKSVKEQLFISMVKKKALFLMENRVNKVNRVKQEKMEPQLLLRA